MSSRNYPLGDPVVVKDTGDVVVYQYPVNSNHYDPSRDASINQGLEYFDTRHSGGGGGGLYYYDEERTLDDHSLAAQDALKLEQDRYLDPDMPYAIETRRKRCRRRVMLITALCLLMGIIVLTSLLANRKSQTERSQVEIGDGTGVNSVEGEGGNLVPPVPTTSPPISAAPVTDSISVAFPPTTSPTGAPTATPLTSSPTATMAMNTLGPVVSNPSLLLDPTTSEGQAYAAVVAEEGLTDAQEIIQRYSLLTLYFASQGSDWVQKSGWNTPGSDACSWFGAGCNTNGTVTTLSLCKY
jgi:hypothetical protein